jgi:hypothetical protein
VRARYEVQQDVSRHVVGQQIYTFIRWLTRFRALSWSISERSRVFEFFDIRHDKIGARAGGLAHGRALFRVALNFRQSRRAGTEPKGEGGSISIIMSRPPVPSTDGPPFSPAAAADNLPQPSPPSPAIRASRQSFPLSYGYGAPTATRGHQGRSLSRAETGSVRSDSNSRRNVDDGMDIDSVSEAGSSTLAASTGLAEPAAVRYARLKQRTQAAGSAALPPTFSGAGPRPILRPPKPTEASAKDTSVNIATAFSQARVGLLSRPAVNHVLVTNGHGPDQGSEGGLEGELEDLSTKETHVNDGRDRDSRKRKKRKSDTDPTYKPRGDEESSSGEETPSKSRSKRAKRNENQDDASSDSDMEVSMELKDHQVVAYGQDSKKKAPRRRSGPKDETWRPEEEDEGDAYEYDQDDGKVRRRSRGKGRTRNPSSVPRSSEPATYFLSPPVPDKDLRSPSYDISHATATSDDVSFQVHPESYTYSDEDRLVDQLELERTREQPKLSQLSYLVNREAVSGAERIVQHYDAGDFVQANAGLRKRRMGTGDSLPSEATSDPSPKVVKEGMIGAGLGRAVRAVWLTAIAAWSLVRTPFTKLRLLAVILLLLTSLLLLGATFG